MRYIDFKKNLFMKQSSGSYALLEILEKILVEDKIDIPLVKSLSLQIQSILETNDNVELNDGKSKVISINGSIYLNNHLNFTDTVKSMFFSLEDYIKPLQEETHFNIIDSLRFQTIPEKLTIKETFFFQCFKEAIFAFKDKINLNEKFNFKSSAGKVFNFIDTIKEFNYNSELSLSGTFLFNIINSDLKLNNTIDILSSEGKVVEVKNALDLIKNQIQIYSEKSLIVKINDKFKIENKMDLYLATRLRWLNLYNETWLSQKENTWEYLANILL